MVYEKRLLLRRIIMNFNIELDGINFEFVTMNCVSLQYQVYVLHRDKRLCFHWQLEDHGKFRITDKPACPETYHHPADTRSDAILKPGKIPYI